MIRHYLDPETPDDERAMFLRTGMVTEAEIEAFRKGKG